MRVIVFEDARWRCFLPLVYPRPTCRLVCGTGDLLRSVQWLAAASNLDEVEIWCREEIGAATAEETRLETNQAITAGSILINGRGRWRRLPMVRASDTAWVGTTEDSNAACIYVDEDLASVLQPAILLDEDRLAACLSGIPTRPVGDLVRLMQWPWDLVKANGVAIESDWSEHHHVAAMLGHVETGCSILGDDAVFVGEGTVLDPGVVIDAREGPVWIGSDVRVFANSMLQGPVCVGDGSQVLPGAIIRESTVGEACKVGGEIVSSILHEYSNKQHHGFLGHSYVGAWVNVGAGTSNSNLKNTYGTVSVPINGRLVETNEQFVGLFAGDHAKIGINVTFPTGSVVGFCSSIFRSRSPQFVPSFSWLDEGREETYDPVRGLEVARRVRRRRELDTSASQQELFLKISRLAPNLEVDSASQT